MTTKVIVIAEEPIYDIMKNSGTDWDVQHRIDTLGQMWDDLSGHRLDRESQILVFTDSLMTNNSDFEQTLVTMAPSAHVFVAMWEPENTNTLRQRIHKAEQTANVPPSPIHFLPTTTGEDLMDAIKAQLTKTPTTPPLNFPTTWHFTDTTTEDTTNHEAQEEQDWQPENQLPSATHNPPTEQTVRPPTTPPTQTQTPQYHQAPPTPEQTTDPTQKPPRPGQITIAVTSSKGGSGKCVSVARVVNSRTGKVSLIEEIVAKKGALSVPSFDGIDGRKTGKHGGIRSAEVSNFFESGVKEVFKVTTRSGRTINATANHPFLTSRGWTPLGDIKKGETVAVAARIPLPEEPILMDEKELDFLAAMLAEGNTSTATTAITNGDPEILKLVIAAGNQLGIYPIMEKLDKNGKGIHYRFNLTDRRDSTLIKKFRKDHGLDFVLAKNKKMPDVVYGLNEEQLARFVSVFWMCDGYVSAPFMKDNPTKRSKADIGVTLASKALIDEFQHLLLRLGVLSKIQYKVSSYKTDEGERKEFDSWRLTILSDSFARFAEVTNLWGEKKIVLDEVVAQQKALKKQNPNTGTITYDQEMLEELKAANTRPADGSKRPSELAADAIGGWNIHNPSVWMLLGNKPTKGTGFKHLSVSKLRVLLDFMPQEVQDKYGWICSEDLYWDDVVSVVSLGERMTYDIEVPETHNFVADDVVVHNSTTAIMLASQIAQSSAAAGKPLKVVLVDMDTRDGQVSSLIGTYMPTALSIRVQPQWDEETVLANLVHDKRLGIDALLAPVRPRMADDVGPNFYRHIIRVLQRTHDVVIMDTSVNYLDPLISTVCLPESTGIIFVTTLAATSVHGMARALREITEPIESGGMGIKRNKIGVVVNQSITQVGMDKDQVMQAALKVKIIGAIPLATKEVLTATNYNRIHMLLQHDLLGPAYFSLAKRCLPNAPLAPLVNVRPVRGKEPAPTVTSKSASSSGGRKFFGQ